MNPKADTLVNSNSIWVSSLDADVPPESVLLWEAPDWEQLPGLATPWGNPVPPPGTLMTFGPLPPEEEL